MKTTIDPAVVTAIATAALEPHNDRGVAYETPERVAALALDAAAILDDNEERTGAILDGMRAGFSFGLHLGARIGADPAHIPAVKDLVERHRFKEKAAVA